MNEPISPLQPAHRYHDRETGLHYNDHRYYNPAIGRYIRSDPIGLGGGLNSPGDPGEVGPK